jgi:hypothetical protein
MIVEDDLTNNDKICFKTFHALCVLYLINVIVIEYRLYEVYEIIIQ